MTNENIKKKLNTNKGNLIVTAVVLVLAALLGTVVGIEFKSFSDYEASFYLGRVSEVQKFSRYAPSIAGTVGDSDIYVIRGTQNTTAVVRADELDKYASAWDMTPARMAGLTGSAQLTVGEAAMGCYLESYASVSDLVSLLKAKEKDVILLSYEEAVRVAAEDPTLAISNAEMERLPKLLILGGTHPNEPAGQLAATLFLENAKVERGILYVVTQLNRSAYTHSQPQEGTSWYYSLKTATGETRYFKYGARATNTNQQWPNPDVYQHSSGQNLSSSEVRNINRAYPGSATGNYTEQVASAVTQLVRQNDISIVIDLHEASPEYITINAMVAHQDAMPLATMAGSFLMADYTATMKDGTEINGVEINVEESPLTLHGLTHRELGDYTNAFVLLCETSNASQGKLHGVFTDGLITYDKKDTYYEYAAGIPGMLYAAPVSINERVARHVLSVMSIIEAFNQSGGNTRAVNVTKLPGDKKESVHVGDFIISNIPSYVQIMDKGVGYYLHDLYSDHEVDVNGTDEDPKPPVNPDEPESGSSGDPSAPFTDPALKNLLGSSKLYVTTVGQADLSSAQQLISLSGYKGEVVISNTLRASEVPSGSMVIIMTGSSNKGLGAAGTNIASEEARANEFAARADLKIVCMHVGGASRRGETSDPSIKTIAKCARVVMVVDNGSSSGGNFDGMFTQGFSGKTYFYAKSSKMVDSIRYLLGM